MLYLIIGLVVAFAIYRYAQNHSSSEAVIPVSTAVNTFREGVSSIPVTVRAATTAAQESYQQAQKERELAELLARLRQDPQLINELIAANASTPPPPPPPPPAR